jgi:uncharacterized protein (DUF433 family)
MLDRGIYTLSEVRRYTKVPTQTLRNWFMPPSDRTDHRPVFRSQWDRVDGDFAVSFLNLIEAHVASLFRDKGIKSRDIRRAHEILKSRWKIEHPFAHADLRTDGKAIILASGDDSDLLIDVIRNQMLFENAKPYLDRIVYGASKMAESWSIATGVQINPRISFGAPTISHGGISTRIVANQFLANGQDAHLVAGLFRITPQSVINAYQFEQYMLN